MPQAIHSQNFAVTHRLRLAEITEHPQLDFADYERRLTSLQGALAAVAVLTATASNNLLKAAYTVGFTGHRRGLPVVGTLVLLSGTAVLFVPTASA